MKPVILLIDLQNDFLKSNTLEPAAGQVVHGATQLLNGARLLSVPVVHVWTTVKQEDDQRMPHWKQMQKWACVEGTNGHATPESLSPLESEKIIHKTFFSAFADRALDLILKSLEADTLLLAGVHLHACIRMTALDAYQRGFRVQIIEDAVASDDPLHAAITRRYLEKRAVKFVTVQSALSSLGKSTVMLTADQEAQRLLPAAVIADESIPGNGLEYLVHVSPRKTIDRLWTVPVCGSEQISCATKASRGAWPGWKTSPISRRLEVLNNMAGLLQTELPSLAEQMALETGKPITQSRGEVTRAIELIKAVSAHARSELESQCGADAMMRYRPVGVISIITPWNNPIAIPVGKIAPALFFGNTVVWKPAPAGSSLALRIVELLQKAGCPPGAVNLVFGDHSTSLTLMADPEVDAATISGSLATGYAAQDICTSRHIPLQAELGGNNAAIVWDDCDFQEAAFRVAEAAFGFAGQRCTANRRVIVDARRYDLFLKYLESAVAGLVWDDPLNPDTQVGPLISLSACSRVDALIERARTTAELVLIPHRSDPLCNELTGKGAYLPPAIICCNGPGDEAVQEETFGPVLVVQRAVDWNQAMDLCNGVRQGLVAALFSQLKEIQQRFLNEARAGILKINSGTADANAEAPFGGWKASGIGPPEHGPSDREFFTRTQAVYHYDY